MLLIIHDFQVIKNEINIFQNLFQNLPFNDTTRIEGNVETFLPGCWKKLN